MLRYLLPSILLAAGAGACGGTSAVPDDTQSYEQAHSAARKTPVGGACKVDTDCVAAAFCDDLGYGPSRCRAKGASGAFCADARACSSGVCTSGYVCGAPAPVCAKTGAGCKSDADCCAGSCTWDSYGPTPSHCYAPQANGSSCSSNRGCASGRCDQYECKAAITACGSLGAGCSTTADCCGTGFCDSSTYGPWKCTAPRAAGDWCIDGAECQSGSCVSYACK